MTAQLTHPIRFTQHLRSDAAPFAVPRTPIAPVWSDADLHAAVYRHDAERYAFCAVADNVLPGQRERTLFQLLASSRQGLPLPTRQALHGATAWLLASLPADRVLAVFLALRRARANHKHTARAILRYVLNFPRLEELAQRRRPAVVDCLEHALGRNVARGAVSRLVEGTDADYVRRKLLRFALDPARVAPVLAFLYKKGPCPAVREDVPAAVTQTLPERPRTITATNRGDIAATLVHVYRGGANEALSEALTRYVREAAANLPHFDGTVALVLDASASTRGYGEREFCCISQSQALRLVLEQCCAQLRVFPVGGSGPMAEPAGDSDLALALLDALATQPDVVAIVSDGYENVNDGDLARVVASLPAAGVQTPVVFCHSKFSARDDLALRRPAAQLAELEFWHQEDFADLLWLLFASSRSPSGEAFVRQQLHQRLSAVEKVSLT